ncbi:MAG: FAD-binding oxidoreductase [Rhodobacteraceae bacterium]|nr:FAD-binding oxidoreductase [Paracoccaceae bacterium]
MIKNENPVIADSLWDATANPAPNCLPLVGKVETDVAVIGGGYTGLSAALHLAEAGQHVTVLEAETIGWGASGRNGGQVNPGLKDSPDAIEARFGTEIGRRMVNYSGAAGQLVFSLIERHNIQCDARPVGWIRAAHNKKALREIKAIAAQWQKRGAPLQVLDADEIAGLIGTEVYIGGLLDHRGGNLHPLNYALGLAVAAKRAGSVLHGHSRAIRLEKAGEGYKVETSGGVLQAGKVLLCTNGYTDGLVPQLAQTIVPIRSIQVATSPLSDSARASILPKLQAPSDMRRLLHYYRMDAHGRFIMGGRGAYGDRGTKRQYEALRKVTRQMFPQIGDVTWQHAWGGFVAVTADHYPRLNLLGSGILAGLGYNGRGVAMATAMGKVMADWATGVPEQALDFPVSQVQPIPFHGLHKLAVGATVARYSLLDRLGL